MSDESSPKDLPRRGGRAAERLREELQRDYGDNPPPSPLDDLDESETSDSAMDSEAPTDKTEE